MLSCYFLYTFDLCSLTSNAVFYALLCTIHVSCVPLIENKLAETPKNRSIGLKDPGADGNDTTDAGGVIGIHGDGNDTTDAGHVIGIHGDGNDTTDAGHVIGIHGDGNDTVRVQDETNMPSDDYNKGLSDDKNVTNLNLGEDEEDEEYVCPPSVPPEDCISSSLTLLMSSAPIDIQATVQPSLTASGRTTILQETPPPSTEAPPPSNGPIQPVVCSSGTECIAQFVNNNWNIIIVTIVLFVLGIIAVFAVLLVLCRKRLGCRRAVRVGLSEKAKQAKQNIHSLIGPNHKGFMKVRTFDSDSEVEDVVFQRL